MTPPAERARTASPEPAARVERLRRAYASGTVALDGVTLDVEPGRRLALLGPNGSGKSTLLRTLAGLERTDAGMVRVLGDTGPEFRRPTRAAIAYLPQRPALDPLLTVRENLALHAALLGVARADRAARIARSAERCGVADRLGDRAGTLSDGLARRADLARALLGEPRLLLLDEPTAGLDPTARAAVLALLAGVRTPAGDRPAVVVSTHLTDEADDADRAVLLHAGRVVADGAPEELRRELGGSILRAPRAVVRAPGLVAPPLRVADAPDAGGPARSVVSGPAEALASLAAELTRRGAAVSVAPPSLADVFAHHTGAPLDAPAAAARTRGGAA